MDKEQKLYQSIRNNNFSDFIELVSEEGIDVNCIFNTVAPRCFLCIACGYGRKEMVKELLERGVPPEGNCWKMGDYFCSIRGSLQTENIDVLKILISHGIDYDYRLTRDKILTDKSQYNEGDEITLWSDLRIWNINEEEIKFFISSLSRKGIARK